MGRSLVLCYGMYDGVQGHHGMKYDGFFLLPVASDSGSVSDLALAHAYGYS